MRVQVETVCSPHPQDEIEAALRAAGERLALTAESVSVEVHSTEPPIAILEFEMRQAAQHKVVGDIYTTVKHWAWAFYEDITIRFP